MSQAGLETEQLDLDLKHTEATFDARSWHGAVHGTVPVVSGHIVVNAQGAPTAVLAELDLAGLNTGNPRRDKDLRGKRFFDTQRYPTMVFAADQVAAAGPGWTVDGALSIGSARCPLRLQVKRHADVDVDDAFVATVTLDPRDLGVMVPRFFVRKLVTLRISTRLI